MTQSSILLIDDEALIRAILSDDLQAAGYDVDTAMNGEKGLEKLQTKQYQFSIMDMVMEGMDGITVMRKAKAMNPRLHVLMISGYADRACTEKALAGGASGFLYKPFSKKELLQELDNCLNHQK